MKRLIFISIFLYSYVLSGQNLVFSQFGESEKNQAKKVAEEFMQTVSRKDFVSLSKLFPSDEANINGDFFIPHDSYIQMLSDSFKDNEWRNWSITALTFDDVISSQELRSKAQQVYRVFNNLRILCTVDYFDGGTGLDGLIILENKGGGWRIYSIAGFGITSIIKNDDSLTGLDHRFENLDEIGLRIPIPKSFSEKQEASNQYFFSLKEDDIQLAQFHIMHGPLQTDIELITFRFIQYAYKNRGNYSDLTTYLFPAGILFEYWVTDFEGGKNKGYTLGIANKDKAIFIQYNSTRQVYLDYWKDLDFTFRNIEVKP